MSVILKTLEFSNMFSYGDNNFIRLDDNKITQLASSNGTGKTSISLIIQELLYNKNVKKLNKSEILNKYLDSKQWVGKITFSVAEKEYSLTVTRKNNSSTVQLIEDGIDISEHKILDTYKKIHQIIGRDFEVFSQLTYQSSTNLLEFLKATDSNRKKFLISLFNLDKYLAIGDTIKLELGKKDKELSTKKGELNTIKEFLSKNSLPKKEVEVVVPIIDESLPRQIEDLELELSSQLETYKKIDKNTLLIKERDQLVFDMAMKKPNTGEHLNTDIYNLKDKISVLESKIKESLKQLKNLDVSDTCYACNQPLDNSKAKELADKLKVEITTNKNLLKTLQAELDKVLQKQITLKQEYSNYVKNNEAKNKFVQLSQLIDTSLPREYPDYKQISAKVDNLKKEYLKQQKEYNAAKQYNESVRIRNAKIDGLLEQIVNFKAGQQLVENDIIEIQNKVNSLTILKKAFSTSGIVAYKLENVAKQLEESINYYLALLSDGQFQVIFRLSGEKLNIVVVNNGEEVSIDSLSGGEFSRVQTSVLLAVRNTLSKIGGNNINLLFLDEIMAVLDDAGKERLIEVLHEEKELNVFLISHEFKHPLIPVIEIKKDNNISHIAS